MKKDGFSQVVSWCRFEWSVHANVVMLRLPASRSSPPWPLKIPPPERAEMKLLHLYNGSAGLGSLFLSDLLIIYSSFDFFFPFLFPPPWKGNSVSAHISSLRREELFHWAERMIESNWKILKKTYTKMKHFLEDKKTPLHLKTDSKIFNLCS